MVCDCSLKCNSDHIFSILVHDMRLKCECVCVCVCVCVCFRTFAQSSVSNLDFPLNVSLALVHLTNMHTNRLINKAVCVCAFADLCRHCPRNLAALKLSLYQTGP